MIPMSKLICLQLESTLYPFNRATCPRRDNKNKKTCPTVLPARGYYHGEFSIVERLRHDQPGSQRMRSPRLSNLLTGNRPFRMTPNSSETNRVLQQAAQGAEQVLGTLLARHQNRLRRMVALRLDRRLQGRIDPSDVIQEAYLEASTRLAEYLRNPSMPFFLWLRFLAGQKLVTLHRRHLAVQMRNAGQQVTLHPGSFPKASSAVLAAQFLGHECSPSEAAVRAEMKILVQDALDSMRPLDREVLALRHFEQLSRAEIAQVLNVSEAAAGKRYIRALERLKQILGRSPGGLEGLRP
jgi:RNA polymerase sigma-70 factor, ECF subfamily